MDKAIVKAIVGAVASVLMLATTNALALDVGTADSEKHGYDFAGVNTDPDGYEVTFENPGRSLLLTVSGYDIDTAEEVEVLLNGSRLGVLLITDNDRIGGNGFLISASRQQSGTNTLRFVKENPGERWGVTNLLLTAIGAPPVEPPPTDPEPPVDPTPPVDSPPPIDPTPLIDPEPPVDPDPPTTPPSTPSGSGISLALDSIDNNRYGYDFDGINSHREGLVAEFQNTGSDVLLLVSGYDIDQPEEVRVMLNGKRLGVLVITDNNRLGGNGFAITASSQVSGTNKLQFVKLDPGERWGVTRLLLQSPGGSPANPPPVDTPPPAGNPPPVETPPSADNPPPVDQPGNPDSGVAIAALQAVHRSGQTFLTWSEIDNGTSYHVYRSRQPITTSNLSQATRLTERWGPLDANTSQNRYHGDATPANLVIADLAAPLSNSTGLFVHTTQSNEGGQAYYAVTAVKNGQEHTGLQAGNNSLSQPVNESTGTPKPVLVKSVNGGKGRAYTQYMDYANWNPTFQGYAYNYSVALPANYNSSRSYPLQLSLHAYTGRYRFETESQYGWQVIQVFPDDPGEGYGTSHTWWYGFAADHDYVRNGSIPTSGSVANFTEQRVMRALDEVIANPDFNVDTQRIHAYGHSMGASGSLTLGMRYGNVLSGIYASQPMTNYRTSPTFQDNFERLWGSQSRNLPIINAGPHSEIIRRYDASGSQPTLVWDWMNHHRQLVRRRGDDMAYLMVDHGKADNIIDWRTQGQPFVRALTDARAGFAAAQADGLGHNWMGFRSVVTPQFGFGYGDEAAWRYSLSQPFIGIHNSSGSSAVDPGSSGDDQHNTTVEWATPWHSFGSEINESSTRFEVTIRSTSGSSQNADITPRRTRSFHPSPGQNCSWEVTNGGGQGSIIVDANGLATARSVPVRTGGGSRLRIDC